jgi:hypothetical protein
MEVLKAFGKAIHVLGEWIRGIIAGREWWTREW